MIGDAQFVTVTPRPSDESLDATQAEQAGSAAPHDQPAWRNRTAALRLAGFALAVGVLALICLLSVAVGARGVPLGRAFDVLWHDDGSDAAFIVRDLRVPRTVLGLLVGAALGLSGALMQGLTRNPLADPGLMGVDMGAASAVVVGIALFGVASPSDYVWFAFLGAALAWAAVYVLGSTGRAVTPERMVLAGAALTAALAAFNSAVLVLDPRAFDSFRFWDVGSLAGRGTDTLIAIAPFLVAGLLLAPALARPLNTIALGDDTGRALGTRIGRTRLLCGLAVMVLCGAATAAAGPIGFVGLTVPHVARLITGPDHRWLLPYSMVLAPILLLGADVLGRVIVAPGEMQVGTITAFVGAPLFIALCRRRRIAR